MLAVEFRLPWMQGKLQSHAALMTGVEYKDVVAMAYSRRIEDARSSKAFIRQLFKKKS